MEILSSRDNYIITDWMRDLTIEDSGDVKDLIISCFPRIKEALINPNAD